MLEKTIPIKINWVGKNGFDIKHFPYDQVDTLRFGFLFSPLFGNCMESFPLPFACINPERLATPMIMVIETSDNTKLKDINEKIGAGQLIHSINNIIVSTIQDVIDAFKKPVKNEDEYFYVFVLKIYDEPGPELPVLMESYIKAVESEMQSSDNRRDQRVTDILDAVKHLCKT